MEHVWPLHEQIHLQELVRVFHKAPFKRQDNLESQQWHPESPVSVWMKAVDAILGRKEKRGSSC